MRAVAVTLLALGACAYVMPATWRAYRIEPDDAPPAITRALDAEDLSIAEWDRAAREIRTHWLVLNDGMDQRRERYRVWWDKDEAEGTLTVFVRHEAQARDAAVGGSWGSTRHDADREAALLEVITREILRQVEPPPAPPPEAG